MERFRLLAFLAAIAIIAHYGKTTLIYAASGNPSSGSSAALINQVSENQTTSSSKSIPTHETDLVKAGGELFQQNCAFCHGRDAQGGEIGPDLTRSKLVLSDVNGDKISEVVRNGRPEK